MAILNETISPNSVEVPKKKLISISCPICKAKKLLHFPESVINQARQLTTISIPSGLVCDHHFQAFVDKNFLVRGYQKVDFEYQTFKNHPNFKTIKINNDDEQFYQDLILEGNFLGYNPKGCDSFLKCGKNQKKWKRNEELKRTNSMSLEEIYNEFWEIIDDNNEIFKRFIEKDGLRRSLSR